MIKKLMAEEISEIFGGQNDGQERFHFVPVNELVFRGRAVVPASSLGMIYDSETSLYLNHNGTCSSASGDVFTRREADEFLGRLFFGTC